MTTDQNPPINPSAEAVSPIPVATPVTTAPPTAPLPAPAAAIRKNPLYAGILSLMPGIGNAYNGLYIRGVTFFLVIGALMTLANDDEGWVFAIIFAWIFNIVDAVRQAHLINYGYAQDLGLVDLPAQPRASQGGMFLGLLLIALGIFGLLNRFFDIDFRFIREFWPLALLALGSWMVWASYRDRTSNQDQALAAESDAGAEL